MNFLGLLEHMVCAVFPRLCHCSVKATVGNPVHPGYLWALEFKSSIAFVYQEMLFFPRSPPSPPTPSLYLPFKSTIHSYFAGIQKQKELGRGHSL